MVIVDYSKNGFKLYSVLSQLEHELAYRKIPNDSYTFSPKKMLIYVLSFIRTCKNVIIILFLVQQMQAQ